MAGRVEEVNSELEKLNVQIGQVEIEIKAVEQKIDHVEKELERQENQTEKEYLRKKEEQLRKEKEQLRKKEEQLRKKEELLIQERMQLRSGSGSTGVDSATLLETLVDLREGVSDLRQLITAKGEQALPKGFSTVGSEEAWAMLTELEFDEVNGNDLFPIDVPQDTAPCADFDYAKYPSENAGTPALLKHHQEQLSKLGVKFGRGGFQAYDLQTQKVFSLLTSTGKSYKGAVDGCIAPYGLGNVGATRQLRICYEHKQTVGQKAEYRRQHAESQEVDMGETRNPMDLQFVGSNKGQAVTELLAAYAVNHFPLLLDLTDGKVHHILSLSGTSLVFWENLTPRQAYFKQAQVLKEPRFQASSRHLRLEDIPEEESAPLKKMRKFRPYNGLLEQLSCLEDLPVDTRVDTALDLFHSWRHITPSPVPIPQTIAHFYA